MAKPTATKTTAKTTPTPAPAPAAKAPVNNVTSKPAIPVAAKPAPTVAKAGGCCGGHTTCTPSYEQVAQRAYEIWVAKGRPQGQDIENWKQAEADLKRGTLVTAA